MSGIPFGKPSAGQAHPGDELDRRLNHAADGVLDEAQWIQLADLILESPEARERYVDLMTLHADLAWSQAAAGIAPIDDAAPRSKPETAARLRNGAAFGWLATACLAAGIMVFIWSALAIGRQAPLGTVEGVSGTVWFRVNQTEQVIAAGQSVAVPAGTLVSDDEGAAAAFVFSDGTRVTLLGAGEMAVRETPGGEDGAERPAKQIRLRKGSATVNAVRQPPGCPLVVMTPTARMEVRGTIFSLSAGDDQTHVRVAEGAVAMERIVDGKAALIDQGQQCAASLNSDKPLELRTSRAPPSGYRHVFDEPPPAEWRGEWLGWSPAGPPRMRAIPRMTGRRDDKQPIVEQLITLRGNVDGQLGAIPATGRLLVTCRVQEPCTARFLLSVHKPNGDFGGNFEASVEIPARSAAGKPAWQTVEVPLGELKPHFSRYQLLTRGMLPFLILLGTRSAAAEMEIREVAIDSTLAVDVKGELIPLVKRHCLDCHDGDAAEAGFDASALLADPESPAHLDTWHRMAIRVENGEMPPPRQSDPLPPQDRQILSRFVAQRSLQVEPVSGLIDPGRPPLRRLTRLEYNNGVRDLLGISEDVISLPERLPISNKSYFQPGSGSLGAVVSVPMREFGARYPVLLPKAGLPGDSRAEYGFTNRGDAMTMSPLIAEAYADLARAIAESLGVSKTPLGTTWEMIETTSNAHEAIDRLVARGVRSGDFSVMVAACRKSYDQARAAGQEVGAAMRTVLATLLASPAFLFDVEPIRPDLPPVRPLGGRELAARLARFLWASIPDQSLLESADAGELAAPTGLERQALRMLDDPRCRELSECFAWQWLRLDQLFTTQPDRNLFPAFYSGPQGKATLHAAQLVEPLLLFETIMVENRSIDDLLAADFTWLNHRLAEAYEIPWPDTTPGDDAEPSESTAPAARNDKDDAKKKKTKKPPDTTWQRVSLAAGPRGGVMTMGGPLTLTSLPTRTSPVKRGAWLLETLLNRPPTEPAVAFALPDDQKQAAGQSVRARFEQHRQDPACFSCHSRLDPPGFALEIFDPIGRIRAADNGEPVDASGIWEGMPFADTVQFKAALVAEPMAFRRGFIEHLLSYAIGRKLGAGDVGLVQQIIDDAARDGFRFRSVITAIVRSPLFRTVHNRPAAGVKLDSPAISEETSS